eukprot:jgi/Orpsp1_1/1179676/evm.model.c7180000070302.1
MDVIPNQFKNNEAIISETSNLFQRFLFNFIPNLIKGLFSLIFHRIPTSIYYFLSRTITFTFQSYIVILILILLLIIILIRLRYNSKYTKTSKSKLDDEGSLFEYNTDQTYEIYDEKPIQTNYPNEFMNAFLASIKVFGYLDKPVFLELANQLQTRMLSKDEVLCRDRNNYNNDFITVVDGEVEVYIPKDNIGNGNKMVYNNINGGKDDVVIEEVHNSEFENDIKNGDKIDDIEQIYNDINLMIDKDELESRYYRLTKVKTGGTLTSLFVILSLLVDKVKNNNNDDVINRSEDTFKNYNNTIDDDTDTENQKDKLHENYKSQKYDYFDDSEYSEAMISSFEYPTMYFKAKKRTTLAVIPEQAFIDLKQKYPSAVSHIIQVILTRFQRVTFLTLYKYLGLTDELIRVEKKVNEFISGGRLPDNFFPIGGLDSLRDNVKKLHYQKITKNKENRKINNDKNVYVFNVENDTNNINKHNNYDRSENISIVLDNQDDENMKEKQEKWKKDECYIKNSIFNEIAKYIGINNDILNENKNQQLYENLLKSPISPYFDNINSNSSEFEHFENDSDISFKTDNSRKRDIKNSDNFDNDNNDNNNDNSLFFVIDGLIEGVSLNKDEGLFKMSINTSDQNIQSNRIHISSNRTKENIHLKAQSIFNKKMELSNRKRFKDRYDNKYNSRLNNLVRRKQSNTSNNISNNRNHDLKVNDSRTINSNRSYQYDKSDTGTLDGTTTELTFSTSDHKTLFYIKPGGLSCYFSILN